MSGDSYVCFMTINSKNIFSFNKISRELSFMSAKLWEEVFPFFTFLLVLNDINNFPEHGLLRVKMGIVIGAFWLNARQVRVHPHFNFLVFSNANKTLSDAKNANLLNDLAESFQRSWKKVNSIIEAQLLEVAQSHREILQEQVWF